MRVGRSAQFDDHVLNSLCSLKIDVQADVSIFNSTRDLAHQARLANASLRHQVQMGAFVERLNEEFDLMLSVPEAIFPCYPISVRLRQFGHFYLPTDLLPTDLLVR